jgi:excinuclease ABC subunit A
VNNRQIVLKKVSVHNLKKIDLSLSPFELIVFTGVSGSGKSSMAFDTIFIEGQRRYLESLPNVSKRLIKEMQKPSFGSISGLSPTIAIEQKTVSKTPRSTVGTITGIYDFLRVLFAKIAIPYCPISQEKVLSQSKDQIILNILNDFFEKKIIIISPYIQNRKSSFSEEIIDLQKKGFSRIRIDKEIYLIEDIKEIDPTKNHNLDVVIDRINFSKQNESRVKEAISQAIELSKGSVIILNSDSNEEKYFSTFGFCKKSNISYPELTPQDFSFNHPLGMCDKCQGLGIYNEFDLDKIIDENKSISEDCCKIAPNYNTIRYKNIYENLARIYKFKTTTPFKKLSQKAKDVYLYGIDKKYIKMIFSHPIKKIKWEEYVSFKGVIYEAHKRLDIAKSEHYRKDMLSLMKSTICPKCLGSKIKPYPSSAKLNNKKIHEITKLTIDEAYLFFKNITLSKEDLFIAEDLISEILKKIIFLKNVGLHYLSIDRSSPSLSGGESQRVRLSSQIGCSLSGATYILDEPSIGLHPIDHKKLIDALIELKNLKNTVIVVEHDKDTIEAADTIVDFGKFAGKLGGEIVAKGSITDIINSKNSLTGRYFKNDLKINFFKNRQNTKKSITLKNASHNNLKNIDLKLYLENFICVTGVSGSGKSSLISDTLYPAIFNKLNKSNHSCGLFDNIEGTKNIERIIFVDQSPIGRTIRSNPATYIKLYDDIRSFFASLKLSLSKGLTASHFSFNVKQGTCPYCRGLGEIKIDMDFLEDQSSTCEQCLGKRFDPEILSILYQDKNIYDVLQMDVDEALIFFDKIPNIKKKLELLKQVGLGYLPIGQSSTTLSGGEAQRIKLAKELVKPSHSKTLYILDEPTTGLHFYDIEKLLSILQELVNKKNTVIVIEHNMDFVKNADYVIELGPKAGNDGGKIINENFLEKFLQKDTPTSFYIKEALKQKKYTKKKIVKKPNYPKEIIIENAQTNNLKNLNLKIPHEKITVFTGPSGSGKTTICFDTIFAESQIRYLEALPAYTRQFLKQLPRPEVDKIENLYPCIALEQKAHLLSPRSTIGTITEIYDHLRILFSHLAIVYSPTTNNEIKTITKEFVLDKILALNENEKIIILSPIELLGNETFKDLKQRYLQMGYLRIRVNNKYYELDEKIDFNENFKNKIYLVIDRLKVSEKFKTRIFDALSLADKISNGIIVIDYKNEDLFFNLSFADPITGESFTKITPQSFSFNSEKGMCLDCQGLGYLYGFNILEDIIFLDYSIIDIAFMFFDEKSVDFLYDFFTSLKINPQIALKKLKKEDLNLFLNGSDKPYVINNTTFTFKGINKTLAELAKHSSKNIKELLSPHMDKKTCLSCNGKRLNQFSLNAKINNLSIIDFCELSIDSAYLFIKKIELNKEKEKILKDTLSEISNNLEFLIEIGLDYLSLDRSAPTLSNGEMQRIKLAKQLGSKLTSCMYILDEPTIGLHPHNSYLLINALKKLKDLKNTLIIVEHDPMLIDIADYVYDIGPKAGNSGGKIISQGTVNEIKNDPKSITGRYLSKKEKIEVPNKRRDISKKYLQIKNANLHNLKNISVDIPINSFVCLSGVSGSGKSTLMHDILKKASLLSLKQNKDQIIFDFASVKGLKNFKDIIILDQSPIGQTSRSDVSTYSDVMPHIREHFSNLKLSKAKGLKPRHFSTNHLSGMCRECWGLGYKIINLQYLPSVKTTCPTCLGKRLNSISLEVEYKNKNLAEILDMRVDEAILFFDVVPKVLKKLNTLKEVGLDYLKLNQDLNSLSGGEAQRIRLAKELSKKSTKNTLYLFDEPTTGLHFNDIKNLLKIFHSLVDKNNTLVIVEHNLDILKNADYIIDLGPKAAFKGGEIVAKGTPEEIIKNKNSYTAKYLKEYLN